MIPNFAYVRTMAFSSNCSSSLLRSFIYKPNAILIDCTFCARSDCITSSPYNSLVVKSLGFRISIRLILNFDAPLYKIYCPPRASQPGLNDIPFLGISTNTCSCFNLILFAMHSSRNVFPDPVDPKIDIFAFRYLSVSKKSSRVVVSFCVLTPRKIPFLSHSE